MGDFAKALPGAVARARTDPVWFMREILQIKRLPSDPAYISWDLDEWQEELFEACADVVRSHMGLPTKVNHEALNMITIRAPHGPGKTFGLAALIHWFGFCFSAKIPCTAPKLKQLSTRLWPEFRKIRARSLTAYQKLMRPTSTKVNWLGADGKYSEDHLAFQETASTPENLAGLHHDFMLFCVDEASGVDEKLWPAIEGAMSTGVIVILVIISNPTKNIGSFADSHLKERVAKSWYRIHISLDKTTRVSRQWVERMAIKYGRDSPVFRVRCLGEFAASTANQLIDLGWIVDARNREVPEGGDGSVRRLRVSVDVSDGGEDFCNITIAEHYDTFTYFRRSYPYSFETGKASVAIAREAARLFDAWGGSKTSGEDSLVVDGIGVGAGTVNWLYDKNYPVINYKGGSTSDDPERYRNRRVQSYLTLRDEFQEGRIVIDDLFCETGGVEDEETWEDYLGQMCSVLKRPGAESVEDLLTKLDMTRQGIKSPDMADGSAMQFATQLPEIKGGLGMPVILGTATAEDNSDAYLT